ncbi:MAG: hypothetical protein BEN19_06655 [Epulopiscium sp. Nuni2H_MBin003]|nr:MAG: hypothetical protein BEN19_06655 [Epulopiscium sp. Nuni2H_MBin003]
MVGKLLCIIWGLSGGITVSAGISAFITAMGVIPRLLQKYQIETHCLTVTTAAILGTLFGTVACFYDFYIPLPKIGIATFGLFIGIFVGCLAGGLTEVLNVFPAVGRRLSISKGVKLFILMFALGKLVGALYYWLYPGFISI